MSGTMKKYSLFQGSRSNVVWSMCLCKINVKQHKIHKKPSSQTRICHSRQQTLEVRMRRAVNYIKKISNFNDFKMKYQLIENIRAATSLEKGERLIPSWIWISNIQFCILQFSILILTTNLTWNQTNLTEYPWTSHQIVPVHIV